MFKDDTVVLLSKILQALEDSNTDIVSLLKSQGVEPKRIRHHNVYIPFDKYLLLVGDILDSANVPGLGHAAG